MTTDADRPFLKAILAQPGDDTPRLVWADRLDETAGTVECSRCKDRGAVGWDYVNGAGKPPKVYPCPECTTQGYEPKSDGRRERAEFIRVQVELASAKCWCMERICTCRVAALRGREGKLFKDHGPAWFNDLPGDYRSTGDDMRIETANGWAYSVRRGFVDSITCSAETWLGGACGRCRGAGSYYVEMEGFATRCADCSGSGRTPGLAPLLYWRPGETVACPMCRGEEKSAYVIGGFGPFPDGCPRCTAGTVPRPMPPTAQPVREVVFTGREVPDGMTEVTTLRDGGERKWIHDRYKGTTFRIPALDLHGTPA